MVSFQTEAAISPSTGSASVCFEPMNDDAKTGLPRPMVSHSECPEAISESSRFEPASEEHVIKYESENDDDDLKAAENGSGKDESDDEEDPNVCTVHTIADLQNVLKSQEDIQVPVHQSFFSTLHRQVLFKSSNNCVFLWWASNIK